MNCPYCDCVETKVNDSREGKDGSFVKRRRECFHCGKRFSTIEKVLKLDLEVVKSDGRVEEFNLAKIKKSLLKACEKRPVTLEQVEELIDQIMLDLKQVEESSIPTTTVGTIILRRLRHFDEIAFLKFAIVHNNYSSLGEFKEELERLQAFSEQMELVQPPEVNK
jgi:transcriptional repressor NrdR